MAVDLETRSFSEVSKGYTVFRNEDILAAKITPCWENGKIGRARLRHEVGVGSTEFHVIRPSEDVDPKYLLHFLRQNHVRRTGELRMTGSGGQRRVPVQFLRDLDVPLVELKDQRRIASILDRADAQRSRRRAQLERLAALVQVTFADRVREAGPGNPYRSLRLSYEASPSSPKMWLSQVSP